ncbi:ABC transporter permease [Arthrobacter gandavensis]|uniref:ABC transporter permease n=1 Tax=Arthrobacter gandavensis TaxID=169960 RepID=A0ABN2NZI7_9MICC|nr:ABC transporter permease [Arthrobacter citreus]
MSETATRKVVIAPRMSDKDPARYARSQRLRSRILGIGTPVILLLAWQIAASVGAVDARFFPAPTTIFAEGTELVSNGQLATDLWATLRSLLIGYGLGFVAGLATGSILGLSQTARAALEPMLSAIYTIPKLAILPLLLLIFGLGELPKILLIALGVFFVIWVTVLEALEDIQPTYLEAAHIFEIRGWQRFRHVLIPAILPSLFTGIRLALANAVLIAVATEFVNGDSGIGYRIWHSWSLFQASQMYVGIVVVAFMGFLLTYFVKWLSSKLVPWAPRENKRSAT